MVRERPPEILAVVPARGGSKTIHRKNLEPLGGHPLLAWAVTAGLRASSVSRTILTTDDREMQAVGAAYGAETPFLRPPGLAADGTPDLPVFLHCLEWLEEQEGYLPDVVVQLRPTSPLRSPRMVDEAVARLLAEESADSVRTVIPSGQNPYKMWRLEEGCLAPILTHPDPEPFNLPRQALPTTYWQTGHVDAARRETLTAKASMTGDRILPLVIEPGYAVDIDTQEQLQRAEWIVGQGKLSLVTPGKELDWSRFKLVVFDFDGVMTDNRVQVTEDGLESVSCHRGDGLGLELLMGTGMAVHVLSKETNPVVEARCEKLGIPCLQGLASKEDAFRSLLDEVGLPPREVIFVGNDVNDLECMRMAGAGVAVADAHPAVLGGARWVLTRKGGCGAVRELCDLLMEVRKP